MENYKEKYEKVVDFIKDLYPFTSDYVKEKIDGYFPELLDKDEKIRQVQLNYWRSVGGKEWQGVPVPDVIEWLGKQGERKWNEEDEKLLLQCIDVMERFPNYPNHNVDWDACREWLKSLKPQKKGWSEEDERMIEKTIHTLKLEQTCFHNTGKCIDSDIQKCIDWLKTLTPPHYCDDCRLKDSTKNWKPTDGQMSTLREAIANIRSGIRPYCSEVVILEELYDDLKKIK